MAADTSSFESGAELVVVGGGLGATEVTWAWGRSGDEATKHQGVCNLLVGEGKARSGWYDVEPLATERRRGLEVVDALQRGHGLKGDCPNAFV